MPRRYRLRLGDGTLLMVDQQGLTTWRVDAKAMVQAAGGRWRPLKDLLAMQQAAAKYAEEEAAAGAPSVVLPLIPPPPRDMKLRRPTAATPPPEAVRAPIVEEPPMLAFVEPLPEEAPEPAADLAGPELATDDGPPLDPADFREEEERAPVPDAFASSEPAAVAISEPPVPEAWVDEPGIFTTGSASAAHDPVPGDDQISTSLPERASGTRVWDPEPSQWPDAVEAPAMAARSAVQTLADDPAPRHTYTAASSSVDRNGAYHSYAASEPGFEEDEPDDFLEPRPIALDKRFVWVANALGVVLSRTLELADRVYRDVWQAIDKAWTSFLAARKARVVREEEEPAARELPVVREEPVVRDLPPLSLVEPDAPRLQTVADDVSDELVAIDSPPVGTPASPPRPAAMEDLPVIPLKPLEGSTLDTIQGFFRRLGTDASERARDLRQRADDLVRRYAPASESPTASDPEDWIPPFQPPREPVKPPPSTSEIPVLRLAKIEDEEVEEPQDVYEGPRESYFPTASLWTKRILWTTVLVGGGFLAFRSWEGWFPKATGLSTGALAGIARFAEMRQQQERERRALQESTEQLPHLAPDTIKLVLSHSTTGVPDPPEVFQEASNAADRGLSALTPEERQELVGLRRAMLRPLSPSERERVREYDDVRARRMPFAFEDKSALDLVARGARALPEESRERYQVLVGKAVASGLSSPITDPEPKKIR